MNWVFVSKFDNNANKKRQARYSYNYKNKREIKDYDVMINWKNLFNQPIKNDMKTYDNIPKTSTDHGVDYTTGFY